MSGLTRFTGLSLHERLTAATAQTADGCWQWLRGTDDCGYGHLWWQGRVQKAHRLAYELFVGPIPEGLQLDHLCRNRWCCNPKHLEPVTHAENMRRSPTQAKFRAAAAAAKRAKTTCKHGHPFDDANTYVTREGYRSCRTCNKAHARRYRLSRVGGTS